MGAKAKQIGNKTKQIYEKKLTKEKAYWTLKCQIKVNAFTLKKSSQ